MTKARDVRELIAEESSGTAERRRLEAVADALEETLAEDVPYRPQFKADLRRRLVAAARRQVTPPWYRRPATWGITTGVAAAALILAVGIRLWSGTPGSPVAPAPGDNFAGEKAVDPQIKHVSKLNLPPVILADQLLAPGQPGPEALVGMDVTRGLKVYFSYNLLDEGVFARMAQGLGFTREPRKLTEITVEEGPRSLKMSADGRVIYTDFMLPAPLPAVDANAALAAARRFLDQAGLPVPSLDPTVVEEIINGRRQFVITYTPRMSARPIINGRTVIRVGEEGRVVSAEAFTLSVYQEHGVYQVIAPSQAVDRARKQGGGTFDSVDLVYVRTLDDDRVMYLQPYWRVYGTHTAGQRMVRFVPALAPIK
ncbi:MAG TPA: hypothetical protein VD902_16175 [Symbiobacteriaceae bacterium]|nr:hypothetical protein [Symbiobacteriaceae bacterium]